jgi:menaquinone-specific isochorismate synthase
MSSRVDALEFTTRELPDAEPLLSWLPRSQGTLSWVNGGDGLVGWGEAARFASGGAGRFVLAQSWWSAFTAGAAVEDEVGVLGTGPVAFTTMAFAETPGDSLLIVPRVLAGRRDGVSWMTTVGRSVMTARQPVAAPRGVRYAAGALDDDTHRRSVAAAVARIRAGELRKVVLARDLVATAESALDERYLLTRLAERYPTCWVYAVAGLIGATPELLLSRDGETVSARTMAGTAWPGPGSSGAAELAQQLLASAKNREEHQYAVRSLVETLSPYCSSLDVAPEPSVVHLSNVSHLATDVRGTLAADTSLLELAAAVHPTAAVSGTPTPEALRLIRVLEAMDRGGYLGPVGWIDARGNGELGVALRCAQVGGSTARLFAGGGIVADSDPGAEAAEVAAKFRAMRSALSS